MKQESMRSIKIVDELMNFCFQSGATNIHVDIEDQREYIIIHIRGNTAHMGTKEIEALRQGLSTPRQEQVEEHYWELAGESISYQELSLVGMMIDRAEVSYDDHNLDITIYRKK